MNIRVLLLFVASALIACGASAQKESAAHSNPFPDFTTVSGQVDSDGWPISGAKLCLLANHDRCYRMPAEPYNNSAESVYQFGLDPHARRLPLPGGGSWIFFTAMFSGGGSGTLTRLAVLRFQGSREIENLLPFVGATNVSDYAIWNIQRVSTYPVLLHADFIWGHGETHFEPHFYTVEAWRFDPRVDRYAKVLSYKTSRRYGGGDAAPVRVLQPEREAIIKRLSDLNQVRPDPHPQAPPEIPLAPQPAVQPNAVLSPAESSTATPSKPASANAPHR
jgi:hypothetical protein